MKLQLAILAALIASFAMNIAFWHAQSAINNDLVDRVHTLEVQLSQQPDAPQAL